MNPYLYVNTKKLIYLGESLFPIASLSWNPVKLVSKEDELDLQLWARYLAHKIRQQMQPNLMNEHASLIW